MYCVAIFLCVFFGIDYFYRDEGGLSLCFLVCIFLFFTRSFG